MTPELMRYKVAAFFGLTVEQLVQSGKPAYIVWPRMVAMAIISETFGWPDHMTAAMFNRHRSLIVHARRSVKERCETDRRWKEVVEFLRRQPAQMTARFKNPSDLIYINTQTNGR
jgi:chromosomal replication initiation ATPase DnaA